MPLDGLEDLRENRSCLDLDEQPGLRQRGDADTGYCSEDHSIANCSSETLIHERELLAEGSDNEHGDLDPVIERGTAGAKTCLEVDTALATSDHQRDAAVVSRPVNRPEPGSVIVLSVPLSGPCRVQNSPANRVPSHGTDAFGSSFAIDLVPVDEQGRSAPRTWRGLVVAEPPETFVGFGRPILAPAAGKVAAVHDAEPDHAARRSPLTLVPYMLGQRRRARRGALGLAGNHVVIATGTHGPFILLAHVQRGSAQVQPGQVVNVGDLVARCGNSGNSTEPHLHLQVNDSMDWIRARGLPFAFGRPDGSTWLPTNSEILSG